MVGTDQGSRPVFDDSHTCRARANRQILPLTHPSSSITQYCQTYLSSSIEPQTHKPQGPAFKLALLSWTLMNSEMFHSFDTAPPPKKATYLVPLFILFPGEKTTPAFTLFSTTYFDDDYAKRLHIDRLGVGESRENTKTYFPIGILLSFVDISIPLPLVFIFFIFLFFFEGFC